MEITTKNKSELFASQAVDRDLARYSVYSFLFVSPFNNTVIMKKIFEAITATIIVISIALFTLMLTTSCSAEYMRLREESDKTVSNREFTVEIDGVQCTFLRLDDSTCQFGNEVDTAIPMESISIRIPSEVNGLQIVRIGKGAFKRCTVLEEIRLESVKPIELAPDAFDKSVQENAKLYVPTFTYLDYSASGWGVFANIATTKYRSAEGVGLELQILYEKNKECGVKGFDSAIGQNVTYLSIPDSVNSWTVTEICHDAFGSAKSLKGISIPSTVRRIGDYAFMDSGLESVILPGVTVIEQGAFDGCRNLVQVKLSDTLKKIGMMAFYNTGISQIELPESLVELGTFAFSQTKLTSVSIPASLRGIPDGCFSGCINLFEVRLHEGLTTIGHLAFDGCSLKEIEFPASITFIGRSCFQNVQLSQIRSNSPEPFELAHQQVFSEETYQYATLVVPTGSLQKYRNADIWSNFQHIVEAE